MLRVQLLCFTLIGAGISRPIMEEDIEIYQKTSIHRHRRSAGYQVDFPDHLEYSVLFRGTEMTLNLQRQFGLRSEPVFFDSNGKVNRNHERCIALYQDAYHFAAVSVICEETTDSCVLQGSMVMDGALWQIKTENSVSKNATYRARRSAGGKHELNKFLERLKGSKNNNLLRIRRDIPKCRIVELMAFVDYSVWQFWLKETGDKAFESEMRLREYYVTFYNEVDMLYQMIPSYSQYKNLCIRIYLSGIYISKSEADSSWSYNNQYYKNPSLRLVNGERAIVAFKDYTSTRTEGIKIDYSQGVTRLNLELRGDYDVRGLAFVGTMCKHRLKAYRSSLIEDLGDFATHVAAREIGNSLGALDDVKTNCKNSPHFIMSSLEPPKSKDQHSNTFRFSDCAINSFRAHLKHDPYCLTRDNFDAAEWDDQKARVLPWYMKEFSFQCRLKYGPLSSYCGNTMEYPVDMCIYGIDCLDVGSGICKKVRVLEETPCSLGKVCITGNCRVTATSNAPSIMSQTITTTDLTPEQKGTTTSTPTYQSTAMPTYSATTTFASSAATLPSTPTTTTLSQATITMMLAPTTTTTTLSPTKAATLLPTTTMTTVPSTVTTETLPSATTTTALPPTTIMTTLKPEAVTPTILQTTTTTTLTPTTTTTSFAPTTTTINFSSTTTSTHLPPTSTSTTLPPTVTTTALPPTTTTTALPPTTTTTTLPPITSMTLLNHKAVTTILRPTTAAPTLTPKTTTATSAPTTTRTSLAPTSTMTTLPSKIPTTALPPTTTTITLPTKTTTTTLPPTTTTSTLPTTITTTFLPPTTTTTTLQPTTITTTLPQATTTTPLPPTATTKTLPPTTTTTTLQPTTITTSLPQATTTTTLPTTTTTTLPSTITTTTFPPTTTTKSLQPLTTLTTLPSTFTATTLPPPTTTTLLPTVTKPTLPPKAIKTGLPPAFTIPALPPTTYTSTLLPPGVSSVPEQRPGLDGPGFI